MNISVEWLSDFLAGATDPQSAADVLTRGGLPVEHINRAGEDTILDVEVTSNRGDCLSHLGVARELAALQNREFKDIEPKPTEAGLPVSSTTSVKIESPALCPHYTARVIRNLKIGPSPTWMVRRLEAVGIRPINNVVDVTNYVMFELGQPLHAFDFDKLAGRKIIVREAKAGEKITSIDGHERTLTPGMLVIADAEKPVALAGVMGGMDSEVSDRTINILLESARFDPLSVRQTARKLAMKSDSSYRFERGIDPLMPEKASRRAAQLILETAGGELLSGVAEAGNSGFAPKQVALRPDRLKKLLGVEILPSEVFEALHRLRLSPLRQVNGLIVCTVPSWRLDLNLEVDLIEEVARVIGYDRIPVRGEISIVLTPPDPAARAMELIKSTLVAAGYFEAVTFTFVTDALAGDFVPPQYASLPRADAAVRKADARLRPSLFPGLLESARRNESVGTSGAKLFETGAVFGADAAGKIEERRKLALVGSDDLHELRGAVEAVLSKLDASRRVKITPENHPGYASNTSGRIDWDSHFIGHLGKIDRKVADKLSLREQPAISELDLSALIQGAQHIPQLRALPRFPAVRRDISLVVSESTRYDALESLIRKLDLPFHEDVEYVVTYRGKPLEKGTKSLTTTLIFRSAHGTLTSQEVEASMQRVIDAAGSQLGAVLRT